MLKFSRRAGFVKMCSKRTSQRAVLFDFCTLVRDALDERFLTTSLTNSLNSGVDTDVSQIRKYPVAHSSAVRAFQLLRLRQRGRVTLFGVEHELSLRHRLVEVRVPKLGNVRVG